MVAVISIALPLACGGCGAQQDHTDKMLLIADQKTDENEVIRLTKEVRGTNPSHNEAAVWARIANSNVYPAARRRLAVWQFFDRHVEIGMTVRQLGAILGPATWLKQGNVVAATTLGGWMPVRILPGELVFVLIPKLPQSDESSCVYLRVEDKPSADDLWNALRGDPSAAADLKVTAVAISAADRADRALISSAREGWAGRE